MFTSPLRVFFAATGYGLLVLLGAGLLPGGDSQQQLEAQLMRRPSPLQAPVPEQRAAAPRPPVRMFSSPNNVRIFWDEPAKGVMRITGTIPATDDQDEKSEGAGTPIQPAPSPGP